MNQIPAHIEARVCAVVVTHNGAKWITDCLHSLEQCLHPVQVILVDNASTDDTLKRVADFHNVICLPQPENLGFGSANNVGIQKALQDDAEYVFLLNQDARVAPETIGKLVRCAQKKEQYGALSPLHLDDDGSELDYQFSRHIARATNTSFTRFLTDLYFGRAADVYPVSFVNAAAWLLPRASLEKVGGFDPLFFMYGEDDDWCQRAVFHEYEIGVVPSAVIYHARGSANDRQPIPPGARLGRRMSGEEASMAIRLKHPSGSFVAHLASWAGDSLGQCLHALFRAKSKEMIVILLAMARTVTRLRRIWNHRRLNQTGGPHWIEASHAG
jgi:GT2 family glycosyltransferase